MTYHVLVFAESIYTYQLIHLVILVIWWARIVGTHVTWDVRVGGKNRLRIRITVCTLVKMLCPR